MASTNDFTEDFLKILRSGYNTEEELEKALASAKESYRKELEAKKAQEKADKEKVTKLDSLKTALYFDYLRYLKIAYPEYEYNDETRKRFLKELDYVDYAVGAKKIPMTEPDKLEAAVEQIFKDFLR